MDLTNAGYNDGYDNQNKLSQTGYTVIYQAYKVKSDAVIDQEDNIRRNGKYKVTIDGKEQAPFWQEEHYIPSNYKTPKTLNYKAYSSSIPLSSLEEDEKVLFVWRLKNQKTYDNRTIFDNLRITTADYSITSYTIKHHLQQLDGTYKVVDADTISESGKVGTPITADINTYTGYVYNADTSTQTGTLEEKKELTLNLYYALKKYPLTYDPNTGIGTTITENHTGGVNFNLTENQFTKKDHAFI